MCPGRGQPRRKSEARQMCFASIVSRKYTCSKTGGTLGRYIQGPLQRESGSADRTLVEEPSNQGDAVRHSPRRGKLRQRMRGVRGPVAPRLRYLHKPSANSKRGMAGKVGDGE